MNIIATSLLAGTFAVLPGLPSVQLADLVPTSPVEAFSVSAAGVGVEINGEGIETRHFETSDFVIELNLKSGAPIRIRL